MRLSRMSYPRAKRETKPIVPIENNEIRIIPYFYSDGNIFQLPIDWLLSLRLKREDFKQQENSKELYIIITDKEGINYKLEVNSANLKRAFGLTTSLDQGHGRAILYMSHAQDDDYGDCNFIHVELIGKHFKQEELNNKLNYLVNYVRLEYEMSRNKVMRCIACLDNLEQMVLANKKDGKSS